MGTFTWVLSTSRPGFRIEGCLDGCAAESFRDDGTIRVISLNILHGFPHFKYLDQRLRVIANQVVQLNPDIVLLQEVPWTLKMGNTAEFLAEQVGMNYAYLRANGNRWAIAFEEGEAILSRYPLLNPAFSELQPQSGFFEHRVVLHLTALTELGEVGLYVTHLTHDDSRINQGQTESLKSFVNSQVGPFSIVAGDFNALPDSPQIAAFPPLWIDPFESAIPEENAYTCCIDELTQTSARLTKRIDYLLIIPGSSTPQVIAAKRVFDTSFPSNGGWIWASDHVGLMADIGVRP